MAIDRARLEEDLEMEKLEKELLERARKLEALARGED